MRLLSTALLLLLATLLLSAGSLRANGCCSSKGAAHEQLVGDGAADGVEARGIEAQGVEARGVAAQASPRGHGDSGGCCGDACRCVLCPCADTPVAPAAILETPFEFPDELFVFAVLHLQLFATDGGGRGPVCAARIEAPPERRRSALLRAERLIPLRD